MPLAATFKSPGVRKSGVWTSADSRRLSRFCLPVMSQVRRPEPPTPLEDWLAAANRLQMPIGVESVPPPPSSRTFLSASPLPSSVKLVDTP